MLYTKDSKRLERITMKEELSKGEVAAIDKTIAKADDVNKIYDFILNTPPPKKIVKYHDYGKFHYLPITAVERLLDGLFEWWTSEILREAQVANGFYVVVRLKAKLPNSDRVLVADGIGFAEFQTVKGAKATDMSALIQGAGVLAIPKAKAEAVKNAAKQFGNLFGRNLARNDDQQLEEESVVGVSRKKIANTLGGEDESN